MFSIETFSVCEFLDFLLLIRFRTSLIILNFERVLRLCIFYYVTKDVTFVAGEHVNKCKSPFDLNTAIFVSFG